MKHDRENTVGELTRLAELGQIFARHGLKNLGSLLGIMPVSEKEPDPEDLRPASVVALLRDVGPVGIKLGQLLATRSDLFTQPWISAFGTLHDQVEPLPFDKIEPVIVSAWGSDWEREFAAFERKPIASASIAQTYVATLLDGSETIVKVRRPSMAARIEADMRLLIRLAGIAERRSSDIARYRPVEFLQTFGKNLAREMDLAAEARACERIGGYLEMLGVKTPAIHWELTGITINVQEAMTGMPASRRPTSVPAENARFAKNYADAVLRMILLNGEFHGDPHPGNVFWMEGSQVGFIDFGSVGFLSGARRQEIVRLIFAIANEQTDKVADLLLDWAGNPIVNRAQLVVDLDELIGEFRGTALAGIELAAIFNRVFKLLRDYRLVLPPDLAILLRVLLTAEGFVRSLAPDYNIAEETRPIVMQLFAERFSIGAARDHFTKVRSGLLDVTASLPDLIEHVASIARSGTIRVSLDPASLNHLTREGDRTTSVKGPLVAALIVSAAILADQSLVLSGIALALGAFALFRKWE